MLYIRRDFSFYIPLMFSSVQFFLVILVARPGSYAWSAFSFCRRTMPCFLVV